MMTPIRYLQERPWLWVAILAALQATILSIVATRTILCCDSAYYLSAGESLWRDGLLWSDRYVGYRFYLTPLVFGFLERISHVIAPASSDGATMPLLLSGLFLITSSAASIFILRNDGPYRWLSFAIPMLLNPLVLTIAPYPLQESVIVAGCLPLMLVLFAHRFKSLMWQCVVAGSCIGIATMTRPTLIWIAIPIAVHVFYPLVVARQWNWRTTWGALVMIAIVVAMFSPQVYIHWQRFHSLSPAPQTAVEETQITYGVEMLEYSTVHDGASFRGLPVYSPYRELPIDQKKLSFYSDHPKEGLFLSLVHMWAAFNFISFRPYIPLTDIGIVNLTLIISALITSLGLLAIGRMLADPVHRALGLTLACMVSLNCIYVAACATENRFGLLGFVALSLAAWQALNAPEGRKLYLRAAPLVVGYVCLCLIINALLYYRTGSLWPGNPP